VSYAPADASFDRFSRGMMTDSRAA